MKNLLHRGTTTGSSGFTMMELVVTIALMGILLSVAVPAYNGVSERMQEKRNAANMHIIREVFFHYFYRMHQKTGRVAHFPPTPDTEDHVMDEEWASTTIDSTLRIDGNYTYQAPKHFFAYGKVPVNSNRQPFMYEAWNDTLPATGEIRYHIRLKDIDEDSPSYEKTFTYSI